MWYHKTTEKNMTEEKQQDKTIYVGYEDLVHDVNEIQKVLTDTQNAGVVMHLSRTPREDDVQIYRATKPLLTEKDVIKETRKFLMLIAIFQGKTALTIIKNPKNKPKKALDFDAICKDIMFNNVMFKEER